MFTLFCIDMIEIGFMRFLQERKETKHLIAGMDWKIRDEEMLKTLKKVVQTWDFVTDKPNYFGKGNKPIIVISE